MEEHGWKGEVYEYKDPEEDHRHKDTTEDVADGRADAVPRPGDSGAEASGRRRHPLQAAARPGRVSGEHVAQQRHARPLF